MIVYMKEKDGWMDGWINGSSGVGWWREI